MKRMFPSKSGLAAALAAALTVVTLAGPVWSATITEGSVSGGDFSGAFAAPTSITNGYDTITGSLGVGDRDFLSFTGLATGAQTVTLSLAGSAGLYLSQGTFRYSTTPFTSNTSGTSAGNIFMFAFFSAPTQTLSFNLGPSFAGSLYLGLNLTSGRALTYSLSVPGNAPVAPVPLPASALLLGGGVAGLGALRRRAKRTAA